MKIAIALCVFFFAALALARPDDDYYTEKYDHIDYELILRTKKLLIAYLKCLLDEGKCTTEGKVLREHMHDALVTGCSKCTEAQKKGIHRVMQHLMKNEVEYWNKLVDKYDPEKEYSTKYEKELAELNA